MGDPLDVLDADRQIYRYIDILKELIVFVRSDDAKQSEIQADNLNIYKVSLIIIIIQVNRMIHDSKIGPFTFDYKIIIVKDRKQ